ncbi:serine/threonine-protein kinase [Spirillospora sp. CA-294931]|uniref:serine/threonine-protein kinase n=1 Tax=Spirillospora sp. CA-294931 TaxID=3240042 RepID=UPI003D8DC412
MIVATCQGVGARGRGWVLGAAHRHCDRGGGRVVGEPVADGRVTSGWRVPGFRELAELGAGAQGRVVLADHEATGHRVAVKYLAPDLLGNAGSLERFRSETELMRRVSDPHVARVLEYVETAEGAAIVMEAIPGRSLREVLRARREPLAVEAALVVLKGSLLGLGAAHAVGVVHRDYKPANVMVQDDGLSKLIDFGVAALTGQGGRSGTPVYMAPEQWTGLPASPATDLYAAACVFVECVTGARPYAGDSMDTLRDQHLRAPIPLASVPEPVRPLVARGLAKEPSERLWDANAFVAELESVATRAYGPDWEQRGVVALGAAAALVAGGLAVGVGGAALAPGVSGAGQGILAKIGGAKGALAIGGTVTAAGVVAAVLFWPSAPTVGGESRGTFRLSFGRPGALLGQPLMPAADAPYVDFETTVTPARVKPGTVVTVRTRRTGKLAHAAVTYLPGGVRQCLERNSYYHMKYGGEPGTPGPLETATGKLGPNESVFGLHPRPASHTEELPREPGILIRAKGLESKSNLRFNRAECNHSLSGGEVRTFVVPRENVLRPGTYLLSPFTPPRFTVISRGTDQKNLKRLPLESAGPTALGALPAVTVLSG